MNIYGWYKVSTTNPYVVLGSGMSTTLVLNGGWQQKKGCPWTSMQAVIVGFNRVQAIKPHIEKGITVFLAGTLGTGKTQKKPSIYVETLTFQIITKKSEENLQEDNPIVDNHLPPKKSYKRLPPKEI